MWKSRDQKMWGGIMGRNLSPVAAVFIPVLLAVAFLSHFAEAADPNCDPSLPKIIDRPYGYRERGDRCEGVYVMGVSSTTLVASFTETYEGYNLETDDVLRIEWDKFADHAIRLSAHSLRRRLHYRMDTIKASGIAAYNWPTDILRGLGIRKNDLGIVASMRHAVGGVTRDVYLPLRIGRRPNLGRSGNYTLLLVPGVEIKEVFLSLAQLGRDGKTQIFIKHRVRLGYGYYPAERSIEIPIHGLKTPGIYYLEIGELFPDGGTTSQEIWFHHAAK